MAKIASANDNIISLNHQIYKRIPLVIIRKEKMGNKEIFILFLIVIILFIPFLSSQDFEETEEETGLLYAMKSFFSFQWLIGESIMTAEETVQCISYNCPLCTNEEGIMAASTKYILTVSGTRIGSGSNGGPCKNCGGFDGEFMLNLGGTYTNQIGGDTWIYWISNPISVSDINCPDEGGYNQNMRYILEMNQEDCNWELFLIDADLAIGDHTCWFSNRPCAMWDVIGEGFQTWDCVSRGLGFGPGTEITADCYHAREVSIQSSEEQGDETVVFNCPDCQMCGPDGTCTEDSSQNGISCQSGTGVCQNGICILGGCTSDDDCPDNGDVCDGYDFCNLDTGECESRTVLNCDDGNACTEDSCDSVSGCQNIFNEVSCDDSNLCTENDICSNGACSGTPIPCDDLNNCNGIETCNPLLGCKAGIPLDCDDNIECTSDSCIMSLNSLSPLSTLFSKISFLSFLVSSSSSASCNHEPMNNLCDDGNPCTNDICDSIAGCIYEDKEDGTPCDDGDFCTENDICSEGSCSGSVLDCDDGDACTEDICDMIEQACINTPTICYDGNPCTTDSCNSETGCKFTQIPCEDNNICTDDSCLGGSCIFPANTASCDDGDDCTENDVCSSSVCSGTIKDCDDSNPCTDDSCFEGVCIFNNNSNPCDDLDLCTENDICFNGACSGIPLDCEDNNICTTDSCLNGECQNIEKDCGDGDPCTEDSCDSITGCLNVQSEIICTGCESIEDCGDGNPCTTDICNPETNICEYEDRVCTDGNVCTTDSCNSSTGCVFTSISGCGGGDGGDGGGDGGGQPPCTPDCSGRECGDDGCGKSCGICPNEGVCNSNGQCEAVCIPELTCTFSDWGECNENSNTILNEINKINSELGVDLSGGDLELNNLNIITNIIGGTFTKEIPLNIKEINKILFKDSKDLILGWKPCEPIILESGKCNLRECLLCREKLFSKEGTKNKEQTKPKNNLCQTCNPDTGELKPKYDLCTECDSRTGAIEPKCGKKKCEQCNPQTGGCSTICYAGCEECDGNGNCITLKDKEESCSKPELIKTRVKSCSDGCGTTTTNTEKESCDCQPDCTEDKKCDGCGEPCSKECPESKKQCNNNNIEGTIFCLLSGECEESNSVITNFCPECTICSTNSKGEVSCEPKTNKDENGNYASCTIPSSASSPLASNSQGCCREGACTEEGNTEGCNSNSDCSDCEYCTKGEQTINQVCGLDGEVIIYIKNAEKGKKIEASFKAENIDRRERVYTISSGNLEICGKEFTLAPKKSKEVKFSFIMPKEGDFNGEAEAEYYLELGEEQKTQERSKTVRVIATPREDLCNKGECKNDEEKKARIEIKTCPNSGKIAPGEKLIVDFKVSNAEICTLSIDDLKSQYLSNGAGEILINKKINKPSNLVIKCGVGSDEGCIETKELEVKEEGRDGVKQWGEVYWGVEDIGALVHEGTVNEQASKIYSDYIFKNRMTIIIYYNGSSNVNPIGLEERIKGLMSQYSIPMDEEGNPLQIYTRIFPETEDTEPLEVKFYTLDISCNLDLLNRINSMHNPITTPPNRQSFPGRRSQISLNIKDTRVKNSLIESGSKAGQQLPKGLPLIPTFGTEVGLGVYTNEYGNIANYVFVKFAIEKQIMILEEKLFNTIINTGGRGTMALSLGIEEFKNKKYDSQKETEENTSPAKCNI